MLSSERMTLNESKEIWYSITKARKDTSTQQETDTIQSENPESDFIETEKQPKKFSKDLDWLDKLFDRKDTA